ncbi:hypothetical protein [Streptomyces varsoviensis]|uniref:Secreted protein n=1 Tax=Streptomyces varsoviensis TaxID=67373 RepID=A0ABR5ITH8_9ACTN|nr:hypothetical protein [Streptomyces varsoviensis]KOG63390.1 hypothetical protein ADK38_42165 [Streptomyces varsoviensis]
MQAVAVIVALFFAAFVALGVIAAVKTVRAVKRGVDRTVHQTRRTVEDTRLKAKQYTQPGPAGELAELRLSLRSAMRATQDALRLAAAEDASLSEAMGLFDRLSEHGHQLDDELRRLEGEPDKARVAARLPELRERTDRVRHSANSLRWAAQDRARRFVDDDLAALSDQIDLEAGALRHWVPAEEGVGGGDGSPGAAGTSGAAGGAAMTGAAGSGGSDGVKGAGTGSGSGFGAGAGSGASSGSGSGSGLGSKPSAISGGEQGRPRVYPWQKTSRPENSL